MSLMDSNYNGMVMPVGPMYGNASNESERMMYQRFIDEAEHM